jgi:hypothetical protein
LYPAKEVGDGNGILARRRGVRLCVTCQKRTDEKVRPFSGYDRRSGKDGRLR